MSPPRRWAVCYRYRRSQGFGRVAAARFACRGWPALDEATRAARHW